MRANKLETALSRDRLAACLAPPDMFFSHVHVYVFSTCGSPAIVKSGGEVQLLLCLSLPSLVSKC